MKAILLAGGTGYIGSHMYLYLKSHGYCPIILDNFLNSKKCSLEIKDDYK